MSRVVEVRGGLLKVMEGWRGPLGVATIAGFRRVEGCGRLWSVAVGCDSWSWGIFQETQRKRIAYGRRGLPFAIEGC